MLNVVGHSKLSLFFVLFCETKGQQANVMLKEPRKTCPLQGEAEPLGCAIEPCKE